MNAIVSDQRRYWWVNQNQTFEHEFEGNYLWSPVTNANGARNEFYNNMLRIAEGDVVFSFAEARIQAIGFCRGPAILVPKPSEFGPTGGTWQNEGWRVPVHFERVAKPLRPKEHMAVLAPLLPEKYSPIQPSGNGNQGAYLAEVPVPMARALLALLGEPVVREPMPSADEMPSQDVEDRRAEVAITNRTDIGETSRLQLVAARRGQGIYRSNLSQLEVRCRVTGVNEPKHLRASHIKPWRASNDFEKLDGNNGLLLSPHIDHLFDRGYIGFTDSGRLIASRAANQDTLHRWSIGVGHECGEFSARQRVYLAYHREFVLQQ